LTDNGTEQGKPIVQKSTDPAPGFYVSFTALQDPAKAREDPLRYVNAETIPYIVIPPQLVTAGGVKLGDFAAVFNTKNQKLQYAIVADYGPRRHIGEGSLALVNAIGVPTGAKHPGNGGGAADGIVYKIFPSSGSGWPKTLNEINSEGERLLKAWGGQQRLLDVLAARPSISRKR
jgi:hypothetical protein